MLKTICRSAAVTLALAFCACAAAQTTITLRDGMHCYEGATDTHAASAFADSNQGTARQYSMMWQTSAAFIRFAIFAAEGGPVPNDAIITSATLSVYQYEGDGSTWEARRLLKNWHEMQATWNTAATGLPWQAPGALGATDIASSADGQTVWNTTSVPGWLSIDVTSGVQAFAAGTPNYGWRLGWVTGTTGVKQFHSSETTDPANAGLRPGLTVTYTSQSGGGGSSGTLRPYNGNPIQIAADGASVFEAEHFDCGGEGVAYHDTTPGPNAGQTFRAAESVDVTEVPPGGRAINNFKRDEWLIYTINVQTAGTYDLGILASAPASGGANRTFRMEINGAHVTVDVPVTADWNDYQWVVKSAAVNLNPGQYRLKLVSVAEYFRVDKIQLAPTLDPQSGCYAGASRPYEELATKPITISATGSSTFEAEYFNCGGEGIAYHELTGHNNAGQTFRAHQAPDQAVDIIAIANSYAVNELETGEWLEYTLRIPGGNYRIEVFTASNPDYIPQVRIELNGQSFGPVNVGTPDFASYRWFSVGTVEIPAGTADYKLRLHSAQEHFRLDKIRFTAIIDGGGGGGGGETDACGDGVTLCASFDVDKTELGSPIASELTTKDRGGAVNGDLVWKATGNKSGVATDPSRLDKIEFGGTRGGVLKMTTQDEDTCVEGTSCVFERSEINLLPAREPTHAIDGVEQWWAHSVYFPTGTPQEHGQFQMRKEGDGQTVFLQFHNGGAQAAFLLEIVRQVGTYKRNVIRARANGPYGGALGVQYEHIPAGSSLRPGQCIHDDPDEGVWYDFVHHIKWSDKEQGFHHIWMREIRPGQVPGPVKKVLEITSSPAPGKGLSMVYPVDWDRNGDGIVESGPGQPDEPKDWKVNRLFAYLKLGNYHVQILPSQDGERLAKNGTGGYLPGDIRGVSSIIHDRVRRGDSFASVAPPGFTLTTDVVRCQGHGAPTMP